MKKDKYQNKDKYPMRDTEFWKLIKALERALPVMNIDFVDQSEAATRTFRMARNGEKFNRNRAVSLYEALKNKFDVTPAEVSLPTQAEFVRIFEESKEAAENATFTSEVETPDSCLSPVREPKRTKRHPASSMVAPESSSTKSEVNELISDCDSIFHPLISFLNFDYSRNCVERHQDLALDAIKIADKIVDGNLQIPALLGMEVELSLAHLAQFLATRPEAPHTVESSSPWERCLTYIQFSYDCVIAKDQTRKLLQSIVCRNDSGFSFTDLEAAVKVLRHEWYIRLLYGELLIHCHQVHGTINGLSKCEDTLRFYKEVRKDYPLPRYGLYRTITRALCRYEAEVTRCLGCGYVCAATVAAIGSALLRGPEDFLSNAWDLFDCADDGFRNSGESLLWDSYTLAQRHTIVLLDGKYAKKLEIMKKRFNADPKLLRHPIEANVERVMAAIHEQISGDPRAGLSSVPSLANLNPRCAHCVLGPICTLVSHDIVRLPLVSVTVE